MLGFVSENLPKTGAVGMNLMGGAGMFSTSLIIPIMGKWYDQFRTAAVAAHSANPDAEAGSNTFLKVAIMPAIVLVVFVIIYIARRKHYHPSQAVTPA